MQFSLVNCLYDYLDFKEFCERANFSPRGGVTVESFSVADGLSYPQHSLKPVRRHSFMFSRRQIIIFCLL